MTFLSRSLVVSLSLLGSSVQAAEPAYYLGKPDCRIAPLMALYDGHAVSWSGACKDGYADGKGVLAWRLDEGNWKLDAVLVRGEITGEATMVYDAGKYIGPFKGGLPNGVGYFRYASSGDRYEGDVVDVRREGTGIQVAGDGSTYEGQWLKGKRHGRGKETFTLGGSYDGEWREDKMHGQGTIVYNGGRTYTGEFVNGRERGVVPLVPEDYKRFGLKDDIPAAGSLLRRDRAIGFAPMDATWQALTPVQKALVRNAYPALDDADEPPYPLKGTRKFYGEVAKLYQRFTDYRGDATVYVTVGADGVPASATAYGVTHQEFARYLATVAMMQRFKPALCAGTPCQMIYPIRFKFTLE
ncbi:MAG: MORN repeat-containing protein [Janthinobacterium lividum]